MTATRKLLYLIAAGGIATALLLAPVAKADPPVCGTPEVPCAGPMPLSPQQQCALIAWRMMLPCNWVGVQVPVNTPGSWG